MHAITIPTPAGPFAVVADEHAVLASGWTDDPRTLAPLVDGRPVSDRLHGRVAAAVAAYLAGDLAAPGAVPVAPAPTPFLGRAWDALRAVPAGATVSYAELAACCGRPAGAARAAGSACARNPTALFVPCHRALRSDGTLGGFAYGLAVKRWLLAFEAACAGSNVGSSAYTEMATAVRPSAPLAA